MWSVYQALGACDKGCYIRKLHTNDSSPATCHGYRYIVVVYGSFSGKKEQIDVTWGLVCSVLVCSDVSLLLLAVRASTLFFGSTLRCVA